MNEKANILRHKIIAQLQEASYPAFSKIERDLLLQRLRDLYELLSESPEPATIAHTVQPLTPPVSQDAVKTFITVPVAEEIKPMPEQKEEINLSTVAGISEITTVAETNTPAIPLNERININPTLNEKLKTTTGELHRKVAVKSLKELIDFNRRIALVNDLFAGDTTLYNQTIAGLDNLTTLQEAETFVKQKLPNLDLNNAGQSGKLLIMLLKQRFSE